MNFDLSEDQKMLVDSVIAFVKKNSPVSRLRALREDSLGYSKDIWRQMAEFGWLSVSFPESVGGLGSGFMDTALILEQFGTALVPEPMMAFHIAGTAILKAGSDEQHARFLSPALMGELSLALAYNEAQSRFDVADVKTSAQRSGSAFRLFGEKRWVLNGHAADLIIVSARTSGAERDEAGISLFALDKNTPGLIITPIKMMDGHRAAMVTLDGALVDEDRLLGQEGAAFAALDEAMDVGAAAACAEGLGIMRTVLAMTTDYLRTREQFGVKIGSFQALQHRAVDMFIETELCKGTAILAGVKVNDADAAERRSAVSAAKVQLAIGGRHVTQQSIQLHGGIGVTDEHDVGLYFKRMHILNELFGDELFHTGRYASQPGFLPKAAE